MASADSHSAARVLRAKREGLRPHVPGVQVLCVLGGLGLGLYTGALRAMPAWHALYVQAIGVAAEPAHAWPVLQRFGEVLSYGLGPPLLGGFLAACLASLLPWRGAGRRSRRIRGGLEASQQRGPGLWLGALLLAGCVLLWGQWLASELAGWRSLPLHVESTSLWWLARVLLWGLSWRALVCGLALLPLGVYVGRRRYLRSLQAAARSPAEAQEAESRPMQGRMRLRGDSLPSASRRW